jgi:hypothetical protein
MMESPACTHMQSRPALGIGTPPPFDDETRARTQVWNLFLSVASRRGFTRKGNAGRFRRFLWIEGGKPLGSFPEGALYATRNPVNAKGP